MLRSLIGAYCWVFFGRRYRRWIIYILIAIGFAVYGNAHDIQSSDYYVVVPAAFIMLIMLLNGLIRPRFFISKFRASAIGSSLPRYLSVIRAGDLADKLSPAEKKYMKAAMEELADALADGDEEEIQFAKNRFDRTGKKFKRPNGTLSYWTVEEWTKFALALEDDDLEAINLTIEKHVMERGSISEEEKVQVVEQYRILTEGLPQRDDMDRIIPVPPPILLDDIEDDIEKWVNGLADLATEEDQKLQDLFAPPKNSSADQLGNAPSPDDGAPLFGGLGTPKQD